MSLGIAYNAIILSIYLGIWLYCVLNSKNLDVSENSSLIKIGISNFIFVENNFISEEFFNVFNQTLIQLKLQQEKVYKQQTNNEDFENLNTNVPDLTLDKCQEEIWLEN